MIEGFGSVGPHTWRQIAQPGRVSIGTGRLEPGEPLPHIRDLAEATGYGRTVISRADAVLAAEGLIARQRYGFIVASP